MYLISVFKRYYIKKDRRTRFCQNTYLCTASAHNYRTTGHILLEILDTAYKTGLEDKQFFFFFTSVDSKK